MPAKRKTEKCAYMKKILYPGAAAAMLSMTGCVLDSEHTRSLGVGDRLPEFTIVMSTGDTLSTASLAGHTSVITFFSTACEDCRRELPRLQLAMEQHPNVMFICIARQESDSTIAEFWRSHGLTLPYSPQPDRAIYSLFAESVIPRIYVTGPDLVIRETYDANDIE